MADQSRTVVVIEDSFINRMLGNPQFLTAFPFLRQYAAAAKAHDLSCRSCGQKASSKALDYTELKRTLASMPPDKHAKLLQMANAQSIRIWYKNRAGEVVKLTINAKA